MKIEISSYDRQRKKIDAACEKPFASYETERRTVLHILDRVRKEKDRAVKAFTSEFDGVKLKSMTVAREAIEESERLVSKQAKAAIRVAIRRVREFHRRQIEKGWSYRSKSGSVFGQSVFPLDSAGIHVPAGQAPLPSTLIMCAVPAQLAGVKRLSVVSAPRHHGGIYPEILYVAKVLGIDCLHPIGGAQSIGALAYGTESVRPVDIIVGPGNVFVQLAKKEVYGTAGIDMLAGPSEVLIIADESAPAEWIAADIMAQAEHGFDGRTFLFTDSNDLAERTRDALRDFSKHSPRRHFLEKSLPGFCRLVVFSQIEDCLGLANRIAPEHAQVMMKKPDRVASGLRTSGSLFIGNWSPAAAGDYLSGSNHVLPTNGAARFSSPLGVNHFYRRTSVTRLSRKEFQDIGGHIEAFARTEGLESHALAASFRLKKAKNRDK